MRIKDRRRKKRSEETWIEESRRESTLKKGREGTGEVRGSVYLPV